MLDRLKRTWGRGGGRSGERGTSYAFGRPLVLLQSDDWGRVGVRDGEGYEELRTRGWRLGEQPYDFYTLETADDVAVLHDLLHRHRDSTGRSACLVMNFVTANLDFPRMAAEDFKRVYVRSLSRGLPGKWKRPGLVEAYREGIAAGVFYPALHGLTHFCRAPVESAIAENGRRAQDLRAMWEAETPYIYWRMPWVGYEYNDPSPPRAKFLDAAAQSELVGQAAQYFEEFFSIPPRSACAPGYRADENTREAWSQSGIQIAQNGPASEFPAMNDAGRLNLYRSVDFEPSQNRIALEDYMQSADQHFARGMPLIVSIHSINFHSTLKDFRSETVRQLDGFLAELERKYPDLLYVHDEDVYQVIQSGFFTSACGSTAVEVKAQEDRG